jgi:hypothetical protein
MNSKSIDIDFVSIDSSCMIEVLQVRAEDELPLPVGLSTTWVLLASEITVIMV